jgi:hypothetical protein
VRFHPRIGTAAQSTFVDRFTDREYVISEAKLRAFCEMTVAIELEVATACAAVRERHRAELRDLFARMGKLISDCARDAATIAFG